MEALFIIGWCFVFLASFVKIIIVIMREATRNPVTTQHAAS